MEHNRQRGDVTTTVIVYIIVAAVVAGAIYAAYRWVDNTWQTTAGITEGKRREHAAMQPLLDACTRDLGDANTKITNQNAAIKAQAAAVDAAVKEGQRQAALARQATASKRTEIQRLNDAAKRREGSTTCPAGEAMQKIREGLK